MARTAPVPNIPAIPGMNPGLFVMGGGGDGGGSGSGKGRNGAGKQGAGGCGGDSTPCGHPSHGASSASAGDPVDIASGAVFVPAVTDVRLESAFPFVFQRFYRSDLAERDVGLGPGWSHSLAWRLEARRRLIAIYRPDGTIVEVSRIEPGQSTVGGGGLRLIARDFGYIIDDGGLQIVMKPGIVADAHAPTLLLDGFGNTISLEYDQGRLVRAIDAAGREVQLRFDHQGRMTSILVKTAPVQGRWQALVTYHHDDRGALVKSYDAAGACSRYEYDDEFRLVRRVTPNGLSFVYRYGAGGRCVETWGEADSPAALGLADHVSPLLADERTPARGIHHCVLTYEEAWVEVITSRGVSRYTIDDLGAVSQVVNGGAVHTRDLDRASLLVGYTDPEGAVTRIRRDASGNVMSVTDPAGATTVYERNQDGALTSVIDALGGVTTIDYAPNRILWRDPIGAMFEVDTDERGLIVSTVAPNGARTRHRHDAMGNEVETVGRYGQVIRRTFDHFGRCTSITDAEGGTRHYVYNDRGDLIRRTAADGATEHYQYDPERNVVEVADADGRVTRFRHVNGKPVEMVRGGGHRVELRYDREGLLVEIRNGLGETHRIDRDARGLPGAETTFDGRRLRHGYDLMGRLAWTMSSPEDRVEYTYDPCGRLSAAVFVDGREERYDYDALGRLTYVENADVSVSFERNAVGWVTAEHQVYAGETHTVRREHDLMGAVIRQSTSAGFTASYERDEYGLPLSLVLDGDKQIDMERDRLGRETVRVLPRGGRIETEYDRAGRIVRRTSHRAGGRRPRRDEPSWLGGPPDATSQQGYHYSSASELVEIFDSDEGRQRLEYDALGQLLAVVPESARERLFAYDAAGNLHERARDTAPGKRGFEPGGRIAADGDVRYRHDEAGRLVERIAPDGVTTYRWTAKSTLDAVTAPDGRTTRYVYDALGRRIAALTTAARPGGGGDVMRRTRFVWDAEELIHDIEVRPAGDGHGDVRLERAYCTEERGAPWAQRLRADGEERWSFSVLDPRGAAVREIDAAGEVVARPRVGAWGDRGSGGEGISRFGLPGQYADETGLAYNRFRYYDPSTGRYLSPDPVGLAGGLNLYAYARNNPVRFVDPEGLMPSTVIYDSDGNVIGEGVSAAQLPGRTELQHGAVTQDAINRGTRFVNNDGDRQTDTSRASGPCAEAAALSDLERRVRKDHPSMSDAQVRAEMRRRVQGGRIETRDDNGNLMAPCPACARMLDNTLGPELAQQAVVAPVGARAQGSDRWNGRSTQSGQGSPLVDRPDDRAETQQMHEQGDGYQTPVERRPPPPRPLSRANQRTVDDLRRHHAGSIEALGVDPNDDQALLEHRDTIHEYSRETRR